MVKGSSFGYVNPDHEECDFTRYDFTEVWHLLRCPGGIFDVAHRFYHLHRTSRSIFLSCEDNVAAAASKKSSYLSKNWSCGVCSGRTWRSWGQMTGMGPLMLCVLTGFTPARICLQNACCVWAAQCRLFYDCSEGQSGVQAGEERHLGNSCMETSWLFWAHFWVFLDTEGQGRFRYVCWKL